GFAITSTVIDLATNRAEVRLKLEKTQPLRIQVLNGEDNAVPEAKLNVDSHRTESQVLDFDGVTDKDGILVWTNAPVAPFALTASSGGKGWLHQKIRLTAEQR